MVPPEYEGREPTYIKHVFLIMYLEKLAYKILYDRNRIINYVDAFAGPWNNVDENDYSDTSFDLALKTLTVVQAKLKELNKPVKLRFYFCEKDKYAFDKLRDYSTKQKDYEIKIFHGKFEENLKKISDFCQTGFTFTFIDPTGWKIDSDTILNFLKDRKGEFLINFMADHINRHTPYEKVRESFELFLANPKWEEEFHKLSNEMSNEERVLTLLKKSIKDSGVAKYTPDFIIQKTVANRVKMRLLLGTNSPKGLEVFRDVQKHVELLEIDIRNKARNQGLNSLFDNTDVLQKSEGIGSKKFREEAKNKIIEHLNKYGPSRFNDISISILENVSIRPTQLKDLANMMKQENKINFILPKGKPKPQKETIISLGNKTLF